MTGGKGKITISRAKAKQLATHFNIDLRKVPIDVWTFALNVELEHGSNLSKLTNVTNDDPILIAKIVIAHLLEFPDYYQKLKIMEEDAEKYWDKQPAHKKNIFKTSRKSRISEKRKKRKTKKNTSKRRKSKK